MFQSLDFIGPLAKWVSHMKRVRKDEQNAWKLSLWPNGQGTLWRWIESNLEGMFESFWGNMRDESALWLIDFENENFLGRFTIHYLRNQISSSEQGLSSLPVQLLIRRVGIRVVRPYARFSKERERGSVTKNSLFQNIPTFVTSVEDTKSMDDIWPSSSSYYSSSSSYDILEVEATRSQKDMET